MALWSVPGLTGAAGWRASAAEGGGATPGGDTVRPDQIAREALQLFVDGKFDELRDRFAPELRGQVSPQQLEQGARTVAAQLGRLESAGEPQVRVAQAGTVVVVPLRYEKGPAWLYVTMDGEGGLLGFAFGPAPVAAGESPAAYSTAPYADPSRFEAKQVTIGDRVKLPGTFTVPKGESRYWAIVLVHGSGPNDADETIGPNKPFRDLAEGLASRGVAVLRYDKRTYVLNQDARLRGQPGMLETAWTPEGEVLEDALAAVRWVAGQAGVRGVVVLGHSLGGMLAPTIAARSQGVVQGIVLMNANARPLEELIAEQLAYLAGLDGQVISEEHRQIDEARDAAQGLRERRIPPTGTILGIPAAYLYALHGLAPVPAAQRLDIPMLLLSGGRDYQVPEADWELWKQGLSGRPHASFRRFANLNHLMLPGEGPPSPEEYLRAAHVDQAVVDAIVAWLERYGTS